jgi:hypothetical protein
MISMEGNTAQPTSQPVQPVSQVTPPQTQTNQASVTQPVQPQNYSVLQSEHHSGKSFIKILMLLIFIVAATAGLVYAGYVFMGSGKTAVVKNANVFVEPTKPAASPTPSVYQSNPSDTTDNAINQDSQITNNNLTNLDSDLNNVDQSLKDQQTNLQ